ncbi:MAG: hypothetical protein GC161_14505 [Planctomycetaceae bacterium]|nr:hypothetical protein [Planctomycetaceae bacterium]
MTQNYQTLVQTVQASREDVEKAVAGNKAACARVRKAMRDIVSLARAPFESRAGSHAPWAHCFVGAIAVLVGAIPAEGQLSESNCNNLGRKVDQKVGTETEFVNCPSLTLQITVGVMGTSVTTPSSCPSDKTTYTGNVYRCEGEVSGSHCVRQGYKVPYKTYSFGSDNSKACPTPSVLTFDDWLSAFAAIACQPIPLIAESFDWSASVSRCTVIDGAVVSDPEVHGQWIEGLQGPVLVWDGDPQVHAVPFVRGSLEQWLSERPRMAASSLPGPVQMHMALVPNMVAASNVVAELEVGERVDGEWSVRTMTVEGTVAADGRFDVWFTRSVMGPDSAPSTVRERYGFDGHSLRLSVQGQPRDHFYSASHPGVRLRFATDLVPLSTLGNWVRDPIVFDRLDALATTISPVDGDGLVAVRQDWAPVLSLGGSVTHWFDANQGYLAIRTEYRDATGSLLRDRVYGGYEELVGGVLRPTTVTERWWGGGSVPVLFRSQSTRVRRAQSAPESELSALGRFLAPENRWLVYQG